MDTIFAQGCLPLYLGRSRDGFSLEHLSETRIRVTHEKSSRFWIEVDGDTVTGFLPGVKLVTPKAFKIKRETNMYRDNFYGEHRLIRTKITHDEAPNFYVEILDTKYLTRREKI